MPVLISLYAMIAYFRQRLTIFDAIDKADIPRRADEIYRILSYILTNFDQLIDNFELYHKKFLIVLQKKCADFANDQKIIAHYNNILELSILLSQKLSVEIERINRRDLGVG